MDVFLTLFIHLRMVYLEMKKYVSYAGSVLIDPLGLSNNSIYVSQSSSVRIVSARSEYERRLLVHFYKYNSPADIDDMFAILSKDNKSIPIEFVIVVEFESHPTYVVKILLSNDKCIQEYWNILFTPITHKLSDKIYVSPTVYKHQADIILSCCDFSMIIDNILKKLIPHED